MDLSAYLDKYMRGQFGISSTTRQSFSTFSSNKGAITQQALLGEQIEERLLPSEEVFASAPEIKRLVDERFFSTSDFDFCHRLASLAAEGQDGTNRVNVRNIVKKLELYELASTIMRYHK